MRLGPKELQEDTDGTQDSLLRVFLYDPTLISLGMPQAGEDYQVTYLLPHCFITHPVPRENRNKAGPHVARGSQQLD
jgi:hypothetical protein